MVQGRVQDPTSAEQFASGFECPHCVRMEDPRFVPPPTEEPWLKMHLADRLENYNQRRYRHYLDDFAETGRLREHLHARCRYWCPQGGGELDAHIFAAESTIAWWEHAVSVRIAEAKGARGNLHALESAS